MPRTIFIGDLHGCADEFRALLIKLDYNPKFDRLYLTGDSFARGPKPSETLDAIAESKAKSVMGNHDMRMLQHLSRKETASRNDEKISKSQIETINKMSHRLPELIDYLGSLPISVSSLGWILVHAGIDPEKGISGTSAQTALTIRTHPGPNIPGNKKWYESYEGETLIIFGHDAKGGIVRRLRNGKPNAIGLDTGCVYGGSLTAYILEEDRFVSVKCAKMYYDPLNADK